MTTRALLPQLAGGLTACGLIFLAPAAVAQEAKPKPWKLHEAVGAPDWLSISGSFRPRYEYLGNTFFAGRTGDDELLSTQTTLSIDARGGDFHIGGELYNSRIWSENGGGGAAGTADALEFLQAYVAWRPKDLFEKGDAVDVTAGRFPQDIGSRRLISRSGFQNQLQNFQGVRGSWRGAKGAQVTGFFMTPLVRQPSDAPSSLDNDIEENLVPDEVDFWGLHLQTPLSALNAVGEVYLFDFSEEDQTDLPSRNRDLSTWGVRLKRAPKAETFDFDLEGAWQTGASRGSTSNADVIDLDVEAEMYHVEAGYTFKGAWSPRVSLHYDFASGDKSPTDRNNERFDTLFGDRAFEFGPTSIYGFVFRSNLSSPGIRIEATPSKKYDLMAMVRQVNLAAARDSYGNTGVRDASGLSGDDAGVQIELRYRRWLVQDALRLQVGGAWVSVGDFFETAPNSPREGDPLYGYAMVTWTF